MSDATMRLRGFDYRSMCRPFYGTLGRSLLGQSRAEQGTDPEAHPRRSWGYMMHRYPHEKVRHFAGKINEAGQVSALCFDPPRPIRLAVASWVLKAEYVTCKKCKKLIAETDKIGRSDGNEQVTSAK